jgi:ferric-dicitrate binding protein FerR (iron transport regulator)
MFRKHITRSLSAYHHGELPADKSAHVEQHLQTCAACRAADEKIRFGMRLASTLSLSNAPDTGIEHSSTGPQLHSKSWRWVLAVGAMAAVVLMVLILRRPSPSWEVTGISGKDRLRPGEVLQTDATTAAQVKIANIGQLTVDPNTRIRLLVTRPDEHRIALDRGKVEATTWSPPRLFIVDTPSARAVDLGCKYTLEVQEDGSSLLHVTLGLVALDRGSRETIVPAGAFCRTRSGMGPGTPFFEDSSVELQEALARLDSLNEGPERTRQLEIVLRESHTRDALSLWHLLPRLDAQSRSLIFDRLAQLLPPPNEVTRDGIVALDPKMMDAWKKIVSQLWQ